MKVFVPFCDEWNSGIAFAGEALVPYRVGLPVWRDQSPDSEGTVSTSPATSPSALPTLALSSST